MTAIALAESGGNSNAHNPSGEDSRGLWQINADAHPGLATRLNLFDPVDNARAAFEVSRQGGDISPWTVTHGGSSARYLKHQAEAQQAAMLNGDGPGLGVWTGTPGYGSPVSAGDPTGGGPGFDGADLGLTDGTTPAAAPARYADADKVDSDADGLIDAMETDLNLDPDVIDSDRDSLSDAYELLQQHTDPTKADTDQDQLADSIELAAGTDPLNPDSDRDGHIDSAQGRPEAFIDSDNDLLSDELEAILGTDPTSLDSDSDGLVDGVEYTAGFDPTDPTNATNALTDLSGDGGAGLGDDPVDDGGRLVDVSTSQADLAELYEDDGG